MLRLEEVVAPSAVAAWAGAPAAESLDVEPPHEVAVRAKRLRSSDEADIANLFMCDKYVI